MTQTPIKTQTQTKTVKSRPPMRPDFSSSANDLEINHDFVSMVNKAFPAVVRAGLKTHFEDLQRDESNSTEFIERDMMAWVQWYGEMSTIDRVWEIFDAVSPHADTCWQVYGRDGSAATPVRRAQLDDEKKTIVVVGGVRDGLTGVETGIRPDSCSSYLLVKVRICSGKNGKTLWFVPSAAKMDDHLSRAVEAVKRYALKKGWLANIPERTDDDVSDDYWTKTSGKTKTLLDSVYVDYHRIKNMSRPKGAYSRTTQERVRSVKALLSPGELPEEVDQYQNDSNYYNFVHDCSEEMFFIYTVALFLGGYYTVQYKVHIVPHDVAKYADKASGRFGCPIVGMWARRWIEYGERMVVYVRAQKLAEDRIKKESTVELDKGFHPKNFVDPSVPVSVRQAQAQGVTTVR